MLLDQNQDYLVLCLLQWELNRPQAVLGWESPVKNAPSWVKRTSSPSVSEPRFFHTFPKVILGFDTQVTASGKPLAIAGASVGTGDGPLGI